MCDAAVPRIGYPDNCQGSNPLFPGLRPPLTEHVNGGIDTHLTKVGYSIPFCVFSVFMAKHQGRTSGYRMPPSSLLGPSSPRLMHRGPAAGVFQQLPA